MSIYAAKVEDGTVVEVIVGDPAWAVSRLGGTWLPSDVKVGVGWQQHDGGFRPPAPYPSWTWDGEVWQPPIPRPEGDWTWDEPTLSWVSDEGVL